MPIAATAASIYVDPYGNGSEDGLTHTYPLGDFYPHRMHTSCWCRPSVDDEEPGHIVHNAFSDRGPATWQ